MRGSLAPRLTAPDLAAPYAASDVVPWAKPDERGVVNDVSAGLVSALLTISRLTFMGPIVSVLF